MKKQAQLKLIDRTKLQAYLEEEIPVKVICKRLDVTKQTIYREIHRNSIYKNPAVPFIVLSIYKKLLENNKKGLKPLCSDFLGTKPMLSTCAVWHNLYEPVLEETAVLSAVSVSFSIFMTCSFVSFRCSVLSVKL